MTTRAATRIAAVWTVVRCTGGVTEDLEVEVVTVPRISSQPSPLRRGATQGKTDEVGQGSPWTL